MANQVHKKEERRVEFRLRKEDKELIEYACYLKGFNLSEFIRMAINKEAKAIVEEAKNLLASKRDKQIFFNALMGIEEKPNEALLAAIRLHNEIIDDTTEA
jgi:uncharacterized protein (DUF1778 family)